MNAAGNYEILLLSFVKLIAGNANKKLMVFESTIIRLNEHILDDWWLAFHLKK